MYLCFTKTFYFPNVVNKRKQSEFKNADDTIAQDEVVMDGF